MVDVTSMIEAADHNVRTVSIPSETERAVSDIVKIAESYHAGRFIGTSPAVAPIAASVAAEFRSLGHQNVRTSEVTVLLDVNFASGTEFSRAATRARKEGAQTVIGLALYQLAQSGPTAEECGLDALVFVRTNKDAGNEDVSRSDIDLRASGLQF